jgi:hypothetical protein
VRLCAGSRFEVEGILYSAGSDVQDGGGMCPQISIVSDHISDWNLFVHLIFGIRRFYWIIDKYFWINENYVLCLGAN